MRIYANQIRTAKIIKTGISPITDIRHTTAKKRKLGIQKGKRETLKSVYNLLKWTETFQNKNLKEIRSILDRYDDKVIWLSRKKDVEKIIKAV